MRTNPSTPSPGALLALILWLYVLYHGCVSTGCSGAHVPAPADAGLAMLDDAGALNDGGGLDAGPYEACEPPRPDVCAWIAEQASRYEHLGGCTATCQPIDAACAERVTLANNCEQLHAELATCCGGTPACDVIHEPPDCGWLEHQASRFEGCTPVCRSIDTTCAQYIGAADDCEQLEEALATCCN